MGKSVGGIVYDLRMGVRNAIRSAKFRNSIKRIPPVVIYQMGKVGSSSIYYSLKESYKGAVLHRHVLNAEGDWQAEILLHHVLVEKRPVKLISLVREPIGRNISAFFQNFEVITGVPPKESKFSSKEIQDILISSPKMDTMAPISWFDENIKKIFDLDVFEKPFPKDEGWILLKKDNIELLLMKAETDDARKTEVIQKLLNMNNFSLEAFNVSENKDYKDLYSAFKKEAVLPSTYLDMLYNAPQVRHFYSNEEIEKHSGKWKRL